MIQDRRDPEYMHPDEGLVAEWAADFEKKDGSDLWWMMGQAIEHEQMVKLAEQATRKAEGWLAWQRGMRRLMEGGYGRRH